MKNTVSLSYNKLPAPVLDEFTGNVITSMTGNTAFADPPIVITGDGPDTLSSIYAAFRTAVQAAAGGGVALTAAKNKAQQTLLDALDAVALYVQTVARYDLATLLTSGFVPTSSNRAQAPLATPVILAILNDASRMLAVRVGTLDNARGYQVQMKTGDGPWQDMGIFPQARRIELTNLTPGTVYTVQVRGIGGSRYYSDWSGASSRMAT